MTAALLRSRASANSVEQSARANWPRSPRGLEYFRKLPLSTTCPHPGVREQSVPLMRLISMRTMSMRASDRVPRWASQRVLIRFGPEASFAVAIVPAHRPCGRRLPNTPARIHHHGAFERRRSVNGRGTFRFPGNFHFPDASHLQRNATIKRTNGKKHAQSLLLI